jgi:hypothetical protein
MNTCLILNSYRDRAVWISRTKLDFCLWIWRKREVFKLKVATPDELLAHILDYAACINKHEDQLRRTTRDLRTRVVKCTEVDGGIFEHLL